MYCGLSLHSLLWCFVARASWAGEETRDKLSRLALSAWASSVCTAGIVRKLNGLRTVDLVSCGILWQEPVGQEYTDSDKVNFQPSKAALILIP